jgi:hypothetical protein
MATPAQILANRSNARFSTGPSTPEGKLASSTNAVRHGLSGVFTVLPHEDRAAFDELASTLRAEFLPAGDTETFLVDQMIQSRWKMTRIERLEMEAYEQFLTEPGTPASPDGRILAALSTPGNVLEKLQRYAAAAQRSYYKALHEIQGLRARALKAEAAAFNSYIKNEVYAPPPQQKPPVQNKPNSQPANLALRL